MMVSSRAVEFSGYLFEIAYAWKSNGEKVDKAVLSKQVSKRERKYIKEFVSHLAEVL